MRYAPNTIPFTQAGYQEVCQERDALVTRRPGAVSELSRARDEGDRSENAAYKAARWELSGLDKRLRYLNKLIDNIKVCTPTDSDTVQIGSHLYLKTSDKQIKYHIVGIHEANPRQGRLSYQSPLGKALLGKRVGESTTITTAKGPVTYAIEQIQIS